MADLLAAQSATEGAMVEGTNAKQIHAWNRYQQYFTSIGLQEDLFLDNFSRAQKHRLLSTFDQSIHEGRYSNKELQISKLSQYEPLSQLHLYNSDNIQTRLIVPQ
jgi:hypothetical protein